MKEWNFKVFISANGMNEIDDWMESLHQRVQIRIRLIIEHLETQKDMRSSYFSSYKGHPYIYRIKFRVHKDYYRIFGCFGPDNKEFTLLIPVQKVAGRLVPNNAVNIAEARYKLIFQDRRYISDFV